MRRIFVQNWWLFIACAVFDAAYALMNLFTQRLDGSLALRTSLNSRGTLVNMGVLVLAAGFCALAAGLLTFRRGRSLLLVVNGVAGVVLGVVFSFWTGPLAFRTIALLVALMAISAGLSFRGSFAAKWVTWAGAIVSIGFGAAFLAFVLRWLRLNPHSPAEGFHWLGAYFTVSALCMLGLCFGFKNRSELEGQ